MFLSLFYSDFPAIVAALSESQNDMREQILVPDFVVSFLFLQEIITMMANMSKEFQKSNQLPYMYPRKFNQFMCKLGQLISESEVVSNTLKEIIENCKNEDIFSISKTNSIVR